MTEMLLLTYADKYFKKPLLYDPRGGRSYSSLAPGAMSHIYAVLYWLSLLLGCAGFLLKYSFVVHTGTLLLDDLELHLHRRLRAGDAR